MSDSKTILYTLAGASFICAVLLTVTYKADMPLPQSPASITASAAAISLDPATLSAKAAIVYDPATKTVLFQKNADVSLPLASLTKLMSAETVLADAPQDAWVTITAEDLAPEGDWGFMPGQQWKLHDLISFGLVASSNDAMAAAATAVPGDIIAVMNVRAADLGLTRTYFNNPTGLDVDLETAGAYGSARDMAVLAAAFLENHPGFFEATAAPEVAISSQGHRLEAASTAVPIQNIPGLIAAKTGYTDLAGGNLVAAFDIQIGRPVIIAVLGSTRAARFEDIRILIGEARRAVALRAEQSS